MGKRKAGTLALLRRQPGEDPETPPPDDDYQYIQDAFRPSWGRRSHWQQSWRSYLDTTPAVDFLDAIGININSKQAQVPHVARLLGESGFKRARIEPGWNSLSYADDSQLTANAASMLKAQVDACKANGLRPLILLNANHGAPCPSLAVTTLTLTEAAPIGATSIRVNPAGLGSIVKGKTGITAGGVMCNHIFTDYTAPPGVDATVQLSQPLKSEIPAGALKNCATLLYEPFRFAGDLAGEANPLFEATMAGWLKYAKVVCLKVQEILGSEDFDIEVWNEQSFGSNFLNINNYYAPDIQTGQATNAAIWGRTLALLRDLLPNVGKDNGFVNQSNGTVGGPGATANSRHPYPGRQEYPEFDLGAPYHPTVFQSGSQPMDASGKVATKVNAKGELEPLFVPDYVAWFPEYTLHSLQTENKVLDLAPYDSKIPNNANGVPHGRNASPLVPNPPDASKGVEASGYKGANLPGGGPIEMWITETNIGSWAKSLPSVTAADKRHLETKTILRSLAYIHKGLKALYFYAAGDNTNSDLFLVEKSFFEAIAANPATYPGTPAGGETIASVRRFAEALGGAAPLAKPGELTLDGLLDYEENIQFEGSDDFPGYDFPDLTNKDCFAFFPVQVNDSRRFVISTYVMTRNIAQEYPGAGPTRFDMPEEKYRMTIGGVKGSGATISALDPITGASVPVTVIEGGASKAVVELKVTDYPRLLTIQEN